MKRTAFVFVGMLVFALMPAVASGQTDEEAAAIAALEAALGGIECAIVEGCIEEVPEGRLVPAVKAAVAALKALIPDLDYGALDGAIADIEAAVVVGNLAEIEAAAALVVAAGAAVVAAANAAAGEGGDGTEEPTTVDTGSAATNSPSTALLFAAGILLALSLGAFAIRQRAAQR